MLSKSEKVNDFNLEEFLSSEREQLQWQSEALPSDKLSIENAIIILKVQKINNVF